MKKIGFTSEYYIFRLFFFFYSISRRFRRDTLMQINILRESAGSVGNKIKY